MLDKLVLITGHQDGKIVKWENLVPVKILIRYTSAIVDMVIYKNVIVIGTAAGLIEIYSLDFQKKYKQLSFRELNAYKLMSFSIKNLVVANTAIYFNTYGGDFIKLKLTISEDSQTGITITFRVKYAVM